MLPKKKKKDEAPLKKKELLKLHIQELDERLLASTNERDGLAAKLTALEKTHQELVTSSQSLHSDHSSLRTLHSSLVAERDALVTRHSSLVTAFKDLESKHSSLVTSSKETSEENELLIQQLHQVQEELEHYFLENKKLHTRALSATIGSALEFEALHFGSAEDAAPHRHLNFELEGARIGDQTIGHARLRLTEHHGRAGLVVFATDDSQHPIKSWREDGREGDRPFLLLVPQDDSGRTHIRAAHAQDLILLRQAALLAAAQLAQGAPTTSTLPPAFWRSVALRFVAFLDEANNDRLCPGEAAIETGDSPGSFRFSITQALVRGRVLAPLCGSWRSGHLTLELPTSGEPPLTAWPRNDDGSFAQSLEFSFERGARQEQKILRASLTKEDRLILAALLKALPDIVLAHPPASAEEDTAASTPLGIRPSDFVKAAGIFSANGNDKSPLGLLLRR